MGRRAAQHPGHGDIERGEKHEDERLEKKISQFIEKEDEKKREDEEEGEKR
jgi:hypothetical protein